MAGVPARMAGGPLALSVCRQPNSAGWAPAVGAPLLMVRVQIIMPEQHGPDPLYEGWVFTSATISATVGLGLHSMVAVEAEATPYIPAGRVVRFMYIMDVAVRSLHLAMDYVLTMIIMAHQGPYLLDFQLELAPMVPLHTLGTMGLASSPTEPASSMSAVPKLSKPKGKSTAKGTATDKDGKAAKGTMVGRVAKVPTVKGTPAKEATPAKELRPAKPRTGVKRPGPGTAVKSTPATTTSSPDKSVKRPTAPDPARAKRDAKTNKRGPPTKSIPIAPTPKGKPVTKPAAAARGIPATEGEHGTQAAPRLASGTETGRPSSQGLSLAGSGEDPGRSRRVFPESWLGGGSGVPRSAGEAMARSRGRRVKAGK